MIKNVFFLVQSISRLSRWVRLVQKTQAKTSHTWAPLKFFFVYHTLSMQQKTENHQNQESINKKWIFWFSPQVTYPDGFT
jgi:hypothetical protein